MKVTDATLAIHARVGSDETSSIAQELEKARLFIAAARDFIVNHHQRSDDPNFDSLCEAFAEATGKGAFE